MQPQLSGSKYVSFLDKVIVVCIHVIYFINFWCTCYYYNNEKKNVLLQNMNMKNVAEFREPIATDFTRADFPRTKTRGLHAIQI